MTNESVRNTRLLLAYVLTLFFSLTQAQQPDLGTVIHLSFTDTTLHAVLQQISLKSEIKFSYSNEKSQTHRNIVLPDTNLTTQVILDYICEKFELKYTIVEEQVIIKPKRIFDKLTHPLGLGSGRLFTISGYISDARTKETLPGANVTIAGHHLGCSTNSYGFYSMTLPEGRYTFHYSYIGYADTNSTILLSSNLPNNALMISDYNLLHVIEIEGESELQYIRRSQMSEIELQSVEIEKIPKVFGESEIIKSLSNLPGIQSFGDGSVYFFVRGGNKDQNLILCDEAPIYNPSHLFGFFSSITSDAIKEVRIFKGDFPQEYGGRLSSLIDIRTKDGNMTRMGAKGNLGLLASRISLEGPLIKNKASIFTSFRRSNLKTIELLFPESSSNSFYKIYFYDLNAKFNYILNQNNRFYLSYYDGRDYLGQFLNDVGSLGFTWRNQTGTMRWNHIFNNKLFLNTTVYASQYEYYLYTSIDREEYWSENIQSISAKTDFSWYKAPENVIKFGVKIDFHQFDPGNLSVDEQLEDLTFPSVPLRFTNQFTGYFSHQKRFSSKLAMRYGLRYNLFQNLGETTIYIFDQNYQVADTISAGVGEVIKNDHDLEPRMSISYSIDTSSSLKLSYTRSSQFIHLLSNSLSPFTNVDVLVPSGPNIKPQRADQIALGYIKHLEKVNLTLEVESYYKYLRNQIYYKDHANMLLNPLIEGELRFGTGTSYGIEFLLKSTRDFHNLNGWISYDLSRTTVQIDNINNNKPFPPSYDRRHHFNLNLNYNAFKRLNCSLTWLYMTGAAITTPTSFDQVQNVPVPYYGSVNNDRLPDYHRLDVSLAYQLNRSKVKGYKHSLSASVFNVYGFLRYNPISINFNKMASSELNGSYQVPGNLIDKPQLVPTAISIFGTIPSMNYKFEF